MLVNLNRNIDGKQAKTSNQMWALMGWPDIISYVARGNTMWGSVSICILTWKKRDECKSVKVRVINIDIVS